MTNSTSRGIRATSAAVGAALALGGLWACSSGGSSSASDAGDNIYNRLGGHAGIQAAVHAIVLAELKDPDEATYFFFQGNAPANGHPAENQVEECFVDLIANAIHGPTESYPTQVTTDAGTFTCREMIPIHVPLLISGGTFDKFVLIAGATLAGLNVSPADIATLADALNSTKTQVVTASLADAGVQPFPGDANAGGQ